MSLYDPDLVESRNYYLALLRDCSDSAISRCYELAILSVVLPCSVFFFLLCLYHVALISYLCFMLLSCACPLVCLPFARSAAKFQQRQGLFLLQERSENSWPAWRASVYRARSSVLLAYRRRYFSFFRGYFG